MHILAISGSLRASSTNTRLVRAIMAMATEDVQFTLYDGLAQLPHFTPDLDGEDAPDAVRVLRDLLQKADAVLICTPEYAFGVPGSLKNALDWTVSSGDFSRKPTAVISASPLWSGGDKAHAALMLTLKALGASVPDGATMMIPSVNKKVGAGDEVVDPETRQALKTVLKALIDSVKAEV